MNDLLQQKKNVSRSVTANYIEDQQFNTVTRYVMLTFSYRFTRLGKGTSEKDINYDGFAPGGHRPPEMPADMKRGGNQPLPMGPPPGGRRPF